MQTSGERVPVFTRNSKLLLSWMLLNSIPIGYMNVVPLVYLLEVGYNPSTIGLIYAIAAMANTAGYIPFGILADRYGRKKFLVVGGLIPCISYAIFGLTLDSNWLIIAAILGGVGLAGGLAVSMNSPPLLPLVAASTSNENRNLLFGMAQGAFIIAITIGSLLSFLPSLLISTFSLSSRAAHSYSYFFMSVIILISVIPALLVKEGERHDMKTEEESEQRKGKLLPIFSGRKILEFSIVFAFSGLGLGVIVQLLPTWYNLRFGTSETTAGVWLAVAEIVSVVAIPMIPWLIKRGRGVILVATLTGALSCLFLGLMPLAGFFLIAALLYVARSVMINLSWPMMQSYMVGVVKERERATAVGITYSAWGLATSVGTLLGGYLLGNRQLLSVPFVIGVAGYFASVVIFYFFFRKTRPPEELRVRS